MKNILIATVLMIGAGVTATASELNKYDSNEMFELLTDYGITPKREVEIVVLDTGAINCEKKPGNGCTIELGPTLNDRIEVTGKDADVLARLLIEGGATQNNARLPATVTAQSVHCVSGGIVPAGIAGANCTVTPAIIPL